jgi:hypothetical protein
MGSSILQFDSFHKNLKENFEPEEKSRLREVGLDSLKQFADAFSVLDFFGGALPDSYTDAKMEANQAGYDLPSSLYDEAAMMAADGEMDEEAEEWGPEADPYMDQAEIERRSRMMEATEAEVAQRKSAIEAEDAEIAKAEADLAVRAQNIKPLDPNAMTQKATLAADQAALEIRKADLAKKRAEVAAMKVVPTQQ